MCGPLPSNTAYTVQYTAGSGAAFPLTGTLGSCAEACGSLTTSDNSTNLFDISVEAQVRVQLLAEHDYCLQLHLQLQLQCASGLMQPYRGLRWCSPLCRSHWQICCSTTLRLMSTRRWSQAPASPAPAILQMRHRPTLVRNRALWCGCQSCDHMGCDWWQTLSHMADTNTKRVARPGGNIAFGKVATQSTTVGAGAAGLAVASPAASAQGTCSLTRDGTKASPAWCASRMAVSFWVESNAFHSRAQLPPHTTM